MVLAELKEQSNGYVEKKLECDDDEKFEHVDLEEKKNEPKPRSRKNVRTFYFATQHPVLGLTFRESDPEKIIGLIRKYPKSLYVEYNEKYCDTNDTLYHILCYNANLSSAEKIAVCETFLSMGLSPNKTNSRRCRPLELAAQVKDVPLMKWFLDHGVAPLNTVVPDAVSALHVCAGHGLDEGIKMLLEKGVNVNSLQKKARKTLQKDSLFAMLLERVLPSKESFLVDTNLSALALAVGHESTVKLLLENGADPNCGDVSPLLFALLHGRPLSTVRLLLSYGADIHAPNSFVSPIFAAVNSGNMECLQYLLERGVNPNGLPPKREGGQLISALHCAVHFNRLEAVKLLLSDPRTDVNQQDHESFPLYKAAKCGNIQIAQLLLFHGADPNLRLKGSSHSCADVAYSNGHLNVASLISSYSQRKTLQ